MGNRYASPEYRTSWERPRIPGFRARFETGNIEFDVPPTVLPDLRSAREDYSLKAIANGTLGRIPKMFQAAILTDGDTDPVNLTDHVFWQVKHPELTGKHIDTTDTKQSGLVIEWNKILATQIKPLLWLRQVIDQLDRNRGSIPREFLLGWMAAESDGQVGFMSSSLQRGYFQLDAAPSPLSEKNRLHLDDGDFRRLSTDRRFSIESGIRIAQLNRQELLSEFPSISEDLLLRLTMGVHVVPSIFETAMHELIKARAPITWAALSKRVPKFVAEKVDLAMERAAQLKPLSDLVPTSGSQHELFGFTPNRPRLFHYQAELQYDVQAPASAITVVELMSRLTDTVFWARHPAMKGKKVGSGTKEATEWTQLFNGEVAAALRRDSTESALAATMFLTRHPEFKQLPDFTQRARAPLANEFEAIKKTELRPLLSLQIARGAVKSRTIFIVDDDAFKMLPASTRERAGSEIAGLFQFVGSAEPNSPVRVIFLKPDRFPESFNFSDAVVSVTNTVVSAFIDLAIHQQTKNVERTIRRLGGRSRLDDRRISFVVDRIGLASSLKSVQVIPPLGNVAIPIMASAVNCGDVLSFLNTEVLSNSQPKLAADPKKWTGPQQDLMGIALGRAIAHEIRHLWLPPHATSGLGSDRANLFASPAGFSSADQNNILTAIHQLESSQGTATVISTYNNADDHAGDFPF